MIRPPKYHSLESYLTPEVTWYIITTHIAFHLGTNSSDIHLPHPTHRLVRAAFDLTVLSPQVLFIFWLRLFIVCRTNRRNPDRHPPCSWWQRQMHISLLSTWNRANTDPLCLLLPSNFKTLHKYYRNTPYHFRVIQRIPVIYYFFHMQFLKLHVHTLPEKQHILNLFNLL